jgi:hypothetical protein
MWASFMVTDHGGLYRFFQLYGKGPSANRKESTMSDKHDSFADHLPLPVYSVTKDVTETVAKKCGMAEESARIVGICTGASASFLTAITTGMP